MNKNLTNEVGIIDIYGGQLVEPSRLAYPISEKEIAVFLSSLAICKTLGCHVGFVDGAYDVPTENHVWSLRDCRHRLAEQYFGDDYRNASNEKKCEYMASDKIFLIVTVDANEKVAAKKSYKPNKGDIARPVYDWHERANRIAGLMIPNGKGGFRPVADLVTVDGDPRHKGTLLESHLTFGVYLARQHILGTWLLYPWHEEWFEAAKKATNKYVVMSEAVYAHDGQSGERSSSTGIINRIKGTNGSHPTS